MTCGQGGSPHRPEVNPDPQEVNPDPQEVRRRLQQELDLQEGEAGSSSGESRNLQNHNPVWCEVMFCFNVIASNEFSSWIIFF